MISLISDPAVKCPSGYYGLGGYCYHMASGLLDFNAARNVCMYEGTELVTISDVYQQNVVKYIA